jgi:hypothetical protein
MLAARGPVCDQVDTGRLDRGVDGQAGPRAIASLGMQTTADPLPLAHAYLRLAEGAGHPPAPRVAAALIALVAAVVLAAGTPVLWASAARSGGDRPAATLPGKVAPAFDADDAPGG